MSKPAAMTAAAAIAEYHEETAEASRDAQFAAEIADSYCCQDCDGPRANYGGPDVPWWGFRDTARTPDLYDTPAPGQTWVLVLDDSVAGEVRIVRAAGGGSFWVETAEGREVLAWDDDLVPPL